MLQARQALLASEDKKELSVRRQYIELPLEYRDPIQGLWSLQDPIGHLPPLSNKPWS